MRRACPSTRRQGQFVREIGRNNYGFAFAHSVRVDAQDNVWAVDEGTDVLIKFSPEGRVLMTIGRREDPVAMLSNMPGGGRYHGRNAKYRFGRSVTTPAPIPAGRVPLSLHFAA
jgi:hypothetical protein